ncbi:MAG: hypothetical protein ISR57_09625 [Bacteroidales bacterium]|nr:hypothetical protein [Bacteroidales bacterium]
MKKKWKLLILIGMVVGLSAILALLVIKYVPWHKLVKIPESDETAFIRHDKLVSAAPNSLFFNFEVDSTQEIPNGIYQGIAYSGNYSAKAFGKGSYSISVVRKAGELGLGNLDGVAMSAWVYVLPTEDEVNAALVFSATNSVGVNICWKGLYFSGPLIPVETWTKISTYYDLSDFRLRSDDIIQLYFWNNSSTDLLVDDFYFVFGAPRDRIGDSALVDMTKQTGYQPVFNKPPFHTLFLNQEDIQNDDNIFLIKQGDSVEGNITPADQVVSGHFLTPRNTRESMLVIKPDGKPEFYHYCPDQHSFVRISLDCPVELYPILQGFSYLKGAFTSSSSDQLLVTGNNNIALIGFEETGNLCASGNGASARLNVIWQSDKSQLHEITLKHKNQMTSGDLNGDRITELLLFDQKGSWKLLKYASYGSSGGDWTVVATGEEYNVKEWDSTRVDFSVKAGPYLSRFSHDILLTTFQDKKTEKYAYSLLQYQSAYRKFTQLFPYDQQSQGLTIGIDTLKPTDRFYPVHLQQGKPVSFLRYNRDWRYDLKDIRFNDTTFQILANIDFSGYPNDMNPKYYEILKIHTGNWINPAVTSVMVIARNCKQKNFSGGECSDFEDLPGLPNSLQIYSDEPIK